MWTEVFIFHQFWVVDSKVPINWLIFANSDSADIIIVVPGVDAAGCSQGQTRGSRRFYAGCTGCLIDANGFRNTDIFFFHNIGSVRQTNVILEHTTRSDACHRHADEGIPLCRSLPDWAKIMKVCVARLECADEGGSPHPLFQVILSGDVADIYFCQITELEWS